MGSDEVMVSDDEEPSPWNWASATAAILAALHCPKCFAQNRPGAHYVEIIGNGRAYCSVCSHSWSLVDQVNTARLE